MKKLGGPGDRLAAVAALMKDLPLPPDGVNAFVDRLVWTDPKTGEPLGALVMWSYGLVSAFLGGEELRLDRYERLPVAAQILVDWGEDLSSAADLEAKRAKAGNLSL